MEFKSLSRRTHDDPKRWSTLTIQSENPAHLTRRRYDDDDDDDDDDNNEDDDDDDEDDEDDDDNDNDDDDDEDDSRDAQSITAKFPTRRGETTAYTRN